MLTANEIRAYINIAYDAVNGSKAGPIKDEEQVYTLGSNTFFAVLNKIIPMEMTGKITSAHELEDSCDKKP